MPLHQLQVTTQGEKADALSDFLSELGALSVALQDAGDDPIYEPLPNETPLWQNTVVTALFAEDMAMDTIIKALKPYLLSETICDISTVGECDWEASFRQEFSPIDLGHGLWICPSWTEVPQQAKTVIHLDPGLAFGTGTHATTFLCLQWLAQNPPLGKNIIDFGCGSGILAIAALKLGASHCIATDISEQALEATRQNAAQNEITAATLETVFPQTLTEQKVDLILANILAQPLMERVEMFARLLKPGGRLILSGILEEQKNTVMDAFSSCFTLMSDATREGWVRMTLCLQVN